MSKIDCFTKFAPHLAGEYEKRIKQDMPDSEKKQKAIELALEEHKKIGDDLNKFKSKLGLPTSEYKDPLSKINEIRKEYEDKIKQEKEYTSQNGKHKIVYDEKGNPTVIDIKTGEEASKYLTKKVINEAADNYDFSKGKKVEIPEGTEFADEKEADHYVVEHTNNPIEVAEVFARQKPEGKPISTIEQMIAEYSIGKVDPKSFKSFGDRNNIDAAIVNSYFKGKKGEKARSIDVIAKGMSDYYEVEIEPQDIVNFMTKFPKGVGDALKQTESDLSQIAREKFQKLTGLPLNQETATKAIDYEYNKLSKDEQQFFQQRHTDEKELEDAYWKQFGNDNATKESNSTQTKPTEEPKDNGNPPTNNGAETTNENENDGGLTGVTHAKTDRVAREFGLGEYEANPETVAEWDAEAIRRIKSNPDAVSELLAKLKKGDQPDKIEQRIMAKYLASLRAKLEIDPTNDKLINDYKSAKDLSDKIGGREVAKSLVARKELVPIEDTIGDLMVREMEALGVDKLTENQKDNIVNEYNKVKKAQEESDAKLKILEEENAKLKAEAEFKKQKSNTQPKKSKEDVAKVREDIKQSIKDKWNKASNDGTLTAVPVPYAKQLAAIAPDVAKLVKSYVEEGVTELKEVVKKVLDDIKEYIPEITEKDVHDLIAGNYNPKKKTRNELAAKLKDLKDEAVYINKLEKLLSGEEPKDEKKKIQRNQQIKELQDKIKEFKKGEAEANKFYGEEIPSDVRELMAYRKRLEAQANNVQDKINKGEFEPEKKKQVSILEDKELQKKYPKQYKEALEAKDKLIKLKQEREIKFLKQQYANRSKTDKVKDAALELINVPRALMSSFDFSAPLRQGIIPTISHPKVALGAAKEMFANAFSQKRFDRYFTLLRESPEFKVMEKAGLYIADPHDHKLSAKEELFMNNLAEKIPFAGKIVAGSERAYVSYLNKMRADIFNQGANLLAKAGKTPENSPEDYKGLASWVNNSTGRGGMSKKMEDASPILNSLFFSPRLIASRLNVLGLSDLATGGKGFYSKLPKEIRKMVATDLIDFVLFGSIVLSLAKANGADVDKDPRSSDFGKMRFGDTRYDIWGGFQQYIRFIAQMITGQQKSSTSDRVTELNGKDRFGKTRADVGTSFFRGKLAPIPSMAWDFMQGRTAVGQKTEIGNELLDHFTPLIRNDIQDAWKEQGAKSLFTIGLPATFGIGVQTYTSKPKSNASGGAGAGGTWKVK